MREDGDNAAIDVIIEVFLSEIMVAEYGLPRVGDEFKFCLAWTQRAVGLFRSDTIFRRLSGQVVRPWPTIRAAGGPFTVNQPDLSTGPVTPAALRIGSALVYFESSLTLPDRYTLPGPAVDAEPYVSVPRDLPDSVGIVRRVRGVEFEYARDAQHYNWTPVAGTECLSDISRYPDTERAEASSASKRMFAGALIDLDVGLG
ncbi:hypothetical protein [Rhodococcus jostii]|uniref:hypothetical protein n=1 Tax=Rhodococcus jostii TaxID=132919 RepID=UPI00363ED967